MAGQFLAIYEETVRGTLPGAPTFFGLPVTSNLQPTLNNTDEPRKEFRGQDTALGDANAIRRESQWTHTIETPWYPGCPATQLLLKHFFGHQGTRSVIDTTAFKGIFYPISEIYGAGPLGTTAIGLAVNTEEGGSTLETCYGGGRVTSLTVKGEGTGDVMLTFEMMGAGSWIGCVDDPETAGVTFPTTDPFVSSDVTCFISTGIVRTGTAPDYTDIDPSAMTAFIPDSFEITLTNGLEDKVVMNGVRGPSKTSRAGQFSCSIATPIDYEDPATGFSSADEFKRLFTGVATNSIAFSFDNGSLAGSATENYTAVVDIPKGLLNAESPERNNEGQTPSVALTYTSLIDVAVEKPVFIQTVDQLA